MNKIKQNDIIFLRIFTIYQIVEIFVWYLFGIFLMFLC